MVEAAIDLRIERLQVRGVSVDEARDRMARQVSDEERRAAADHLVINDSDLTALTAQVDDPWSALTGRPNYEPEPAGPPPCTQGG